MREARHIFAQIPRVEGLEQTARIGGMTSSTHGTFQAPWSHLPVPKAERLKRMTGVLLRWSARSIYVSPVLLLLRFGPGELGDAGVVIIVGLGVLFFSLLNSFVFLSLLSWRTRRRLPPTPQLLLPFSLTGQDVLGLLNGGSEPSASVRPNQRIFVRGTVRGMHGVPRGAPVLDDYWWLEEPARLTEATDFLVDRGDQPPVLLEFESAPILIGRPETLQPNAISVGQGTVELLPIPALPKSACERVQLCDGDEVELVGSVERLVDDVLAKDALDEGAGPYRKTASRTGILVRSSYLSPACLRLVRSGTRHLATGGRR